MTHGIHGRQRWWALLVLCLGVLMIVLDTTIVNVALPSIRQDLHFTETSLVWVVNAIGWREALVILALVTLAVAATILAFVRNPPHPEGSQARGSLGDLLRVRALWPILPLLGVIERPAPIPNTIEEDWNAHYERLTTPAE